MLLLRTLETRYVSPGGLGDKPGRPPGPPASAEKGRPVDPLTFPAAMSHRKKVLLKVIILGDSGYASHALVFFA
jgi:hypothetical protein